jgi:hypothetical protein
MKLLLKLFFLFFSINLLADSDYLPPIKEMHCAGDGFNLYISGGYLFKGTIDGYPISGLDMSPKNDELKKLTAFFDPKPSGVKETMIDMQFKKANKVLTGTIQVWYSNGRDKEVRSLFGRCQEI